MRQFMLAMAAAAALIAPAHAQAEVTQVTFGPKLEEKLVEDYGVREKAEIERFVREYLAAAFERRGITSDVDIAVTVQEATPNKPTFEQLSDRPSLDYGRSLGIGGAAFTASLTGSQGENLGEVSYRWFETDIRNVPVATTWSDARRAARMFANRVAEKVAAHQGAGGSAAPAS